MRNADAITQTGKSSSVSNIQILLGLYNKASLEARKFETMKNLLPEYRTRSGYMLKCDCSIAEPNYTSLDRRARPDVISTPTLSLFTSES